MLLSPLLEKIKKLSPNRDIELIAVTKNRTLDDIKPLLDQGIKAVGENRIQEMEQKIEGLATVEKHLIGPLQSNKENKALDFFDVIQSVESLEQLQRLINKIEQQKLSTKLFLQYNTSLEESKHGVRTREDLCSMVELLLAHPQVGFQGLMTIGALSKDEKIVRKSFEQLRLLREDLLSRYYELSSLTLSMGMSDDFEWALKEGADMLRLGRILYQ